MCTEKAGCVWINIKKSVPCAQKSERIVNSSISFRICLHCRT